MQVPRSAIGLFLADGVYAKLSWLPIEVYDCSVAPDVAGDVPVLLLVTACCERASGCWERISVWPAVPCVVVLGACLGLLGLHSKSLGA